MMPIVDCGDGVFVTGAAGCNEGGSRFRRQIHIWHDPQRIVDVGGTCAAIKAGATAGGLVVQYTDGESLAAAVSLAEVVAYCAAPGDLLIHCAFGQCRGPTLGVLAKVARGAPPLLALQNITAAIWSQRRIIPHWCPIPLAEIFEFAER